VSSQKIPAESDPGGLIDSKSTSIQEED